MNAREKVINWLSDNTRKPESCRVIPTIENIINTVGVSRSTVYRMIKNNDIVYTGCTYGETYQKLYKVN